MRVGALTNEWLFKNVYWLEQIFVLLLNNEKRSFPIEGTADILILHNIPLPP